MSQRVCSKCDKNKDESEYFQRSKGRQTQCKACMKAYSVQYERTRYNVDPVFRERKKERLRQSVERRKQRDTLRYAAENEAILREALLSQHQTETECV